MIRQKREGDEVRCVANSEWGRGSGFQGGQEKAVYEQKKPPPTCRARPGQKSEATGRELTTKTGGDSRRLSPILDPCF